MEFLIVWANNDNANFLFRRGNPQSPNLQSPNLHLQGKISSRAHMCREEGGGGGGGGGWAEVM